MAARGSSKERGFKQREEDEVVFDPIMVAAHRVGDFSYTLYMPFLLLFSFTYIHTFANFDLAVALSVHHLYIFAILRYIHCDSQSYEQHIQSRIPIMDSYTVGGHLEASL